MTEYRKQLIGNKGGGEVYTPVEEPDSLQSKATAKIVDLLCIGEIQGWANGSDSLYKSVYLNEIPVMANDGSLNFEGVEITGRKGTTSQSYMRGYDAVETEKGTTAEVTNDSGGYDSIQITDSDVDDVRVTLSVNGFLNQESDGDIRATTVNYRIQIKGDGGVYATAVDSSITGKTTTTYQKAHLLRNITQYGSAPYTIKIIKDTSDSTSVKLQNKLYYQSHTEIKNVKLRYPDSVVVGLDIDSEKFGSQVPNRYYKIKGRKCRVPNNYSPSAANLYGEDLYSGTWDGTSYVWAYTTNPVWILFDVITSEEGLNLPDSTVDVWSFYTASIYCDGEIEYKEKIKNALGTYDTYDRSERRYQFDGIILDRRQALEVINHLASVIGGYPIWQDGQMSLVVDRPKNVTRVASFANVKDGLFIYSGTPKGTRHTVCRVQYNDKENFGKPNIVTLQDDEGLRTYGFNPIDIVAYGCSRRTEAIRRGRMLMHTDLNNNEIVTFTGGLEWASAEIGELMEVQDPDMYTFSTYYSGRIKSGTTTSIELDRAVNLDSTKTYTLHLQTEGDAAIITTLNVPSTQDYTSLSWNVSEALDNTPERDFVFSIYCAEVETARRFIISGLTEVEFGREYQVEGILYDENKWTVVEGDNTVILDEGPEYQGEIAPPSNLDAQIFTYQEGSGSAKVRKYGVLLSWVNGDDPRIIEYEVRNRYGSSVTWNFAGTTGQNSLTIENLITGTYDFAVRAKALAGSSVWVNLNDVVVNAALDAPPPPRNLQIKGGGSVFNGRDCHVEWDSPNDSTYTDSYVASAGVGSANLNYKVEVYTIGDSLLRTFYTASDQELEYIYTYGMNVDDNSNSPLRTFRIDVTTVDSYGSESVSAATLVCSNPAPSMASSKPVLTPKTGYLKCNWDAVADNDMSYYEVYVGTSTNPDSLVSVVTHPNTVLNISDVTSDSTYRVKVIPYDLFGAGTQSQISDGSTPLQLVDININNELEESVKITDSVGSDIDRLRSLYDHESSSGGLVYKASVAGDDIWIQYSYSIENMIDRVVIYLEDGDKIECFIGYSLDGENFDYLKYDGDSTITDAETDTVYAVDLADAQANPLIVDTTDRTKFSFVLPNNIPVRYVRLYITALTSDYFVNIHELSLIHI